MVRFVGTEKCEMDNDTFLYRHINNPDFIQNGKVISSVYTPTKTDEGRLSVFDGSKTTLQKSLECRKPEKPVLAVSAVLVSECSGVGPTNTWNLPVKDDPTEDNPAHAVIDFTGLPSKSSYSHAARTLKDRANDRGLVWPKRDQI